MESFPALQSHFRKQTVASLYKSDWCLCLSWLNRADLHIPACLAYNLLYIRINGHKLIAVPERWRDRSLACFRTGQMSLVWYRNMMPNMHAWIQTHSIGAFSCSCFMVATGELERPHSEEINGNGACEYVAFYAND